VRYEFKPSFRWRQDLIEFVLAGDHDSIKDFLKNC